MGGQEEKEEPRTIKKSTYQFAVILAVVIGFVVGLCFIRVRDQLCSALPHQINERWRTEAADAGRAEFYLDSTYKRQWRWLPVEKKKEE